MEAGAKQLSTYLPTYLPTYILLYFEVICAHNEEIPREGGNVAWRMRTWEADVQHELHTHILR
jgi:hypothetical protein